MKDTSSTTEYFQARMDHELLAGETLRWIGQPRPARMARQDWSYSVFGLVWLGIVIFMYSQFSQSFIRPTAFSRTTAFSQFNSVFQLILGLFFLVGLGIILSPLWRAYMATQTVYGITDRRFIIIKDYGIQALGFLLHRSVISYGEQEIDRIERREMAGGYGDLIIGYETRTRRHRSSSGFSRTSTYRVPIGLFGIPNVREVEALVLETFLPKRGMMTVQMQRDRGVDLPPKRPPTPDEAWRDKYGDDWANR